jgi:hypothetical protein
MTTVQMRHGVLGRLAGVLSAGLLVAACSTTAGDSTETSAAASTDIAPPTEPAAAPSEMASSDAPAATEAADASEPATVEVSTDALDPANFDDPATGRNPYFPLVPGLQSVREGSTRVGGRTVPHQVSTTITDVYREIAGVRTVAVLDREIDAGQVRQISVDYMAEDKAGNVWLVGGYTEQYEGGQFVAAMDSWLHGVNGAEAGILVPADPQVGSPQYTIAKLVQEKDDVAQVEEVGVRHCVPFDCFDDVLIVREGKADAPDNEFKYYARNVGQIDNVPRKDSRGKDVEPLINVTELSGATLRESSREALRLDHHAAETAPDVFGDQPQGERIKG